MIMLIIIKGSKLAKDTDCNSNFFSVSDIESCIIFSKCHFSFKMKSLQSPRILSASQHFTSGSGTLRRKKLLAGNISYEQLVFKENDFPSVLFSSSNQGVLVLLIVQYIHYTSLLSNIPVLQKCFKKILLRLY